MTATRLFAALILTTAFSTAAAAQETNPVLGRTSELTIREADLDRILASQPPALQKRIQDDPQQRAALVREILLKRAVASKARKAGFDRRADIKEQLGYVVDSYLTQEYLAKVVTAGVSASDDEIRKYYQEHGNELMQPEEATVRHILIASVKDDPADSKAKARSRAEEVLKRLGQGEDFARLAGEYSDDQNSSSKGGLLTPITPGGTNSEEFEKAVFSLKAGKTSDIITTAYGFHILKLEKHSDKRQIPFSEAREAIAGLLKNELEQKKIREFVDQVIRESALEITGDKEAESPAISGAAADRNGAGQTPDRR